MASNTKGFENSSLLKFVLGLWGLGRFHECWRSLVVSGNCSLGPVDLVVAKACGLVLVSILWRLLIYIVHLVSALGYGRNSSRSHNWRFLLIHQSSNELLLLLKALGGSMHALFLAHCILEVDKDSLSTFDCHWWNPVLHYYYWLMSTLHCFGRSVAVFFINNVALSRSRVKALEIKLLVVASGSCWSSRNETSYRFMTLPLHWLYWWSVARWVCERLLHLPICNVWKLSCLHSLVIRGLRHYIDSARVHLTTV